MKSLFYKFMMSAALGLFSFSAFASDAYEIRIPYSNEKVKAPDPEPSDESCLAVLNTGGSKGDGIYSLTLEGTTTPVNVYCDMTSAGGGWMLVLHWAIAADLPRSYNSHEIMVKGQSLQTHSASPQSFPALPLGLTNNFNEQLFKGGTPDFRAKVGANWFYYNIINPAELPVVTYPITTAAGQSATMQAGGAGFGNSIKIGTSQNTFGYWPSGSSICGGPGGSSNPPNCPFAHNVNYHAHWDYSSPKFVFVR